MRSDAAQRAQQHCAPLLQDEDKWRRMVQPVRTDRAHSAGMGTDRLWL